MHADVDVKVDTEVVVGLKKLTLCLAKKCYVQFNNISKLICTVLCTNFMKLSSGLLGR